MRTVAIQQNVLTIRIKTSRLVSSRLSESLTEHFKLGGRCKCNFKKSHTEPACNTITKGKDLMCTTCSNYVRNNLKNQDLDQETKDHYQELMDKHDAEHERHKEKDWNKNKSRTEEQNR